MSSFLHSIALITLPLGSILKGYNDTCDSLSSYTHHFINLILLVMLSKIGLVFTEYLDSRADFFDSDSLMKVWQVFKLWYTPLDCPVSFQVKEACRRCLRFSFQHPLSPSIQAISFLLASMTRWGIYLLDILLILSMYKGHPIDTEYSNIKCWKDVTFVVSWTPICPSKLVWLTRLHAGSERNVSKLTLDGVDVMGERLAEEVGLAFRYWVIFWRKTENGTEIEVKVQKKYR